MLHYHKMWTLIDKVMMEKLTKREDFNRLLMSAKVQLLKVLEMFVKSQASMLVSHLPWLIKVMRFVAQGLSSEWINVQV